MAKWIMNMNPAFIVHWVILIKTDPKVYLFKLLYKQCPKSSRKRGCKNIKIQEIEMG